MGYMAREMILPKPSYLYNDMFISNILINQTKRIADILNIFGHSNFYDIKTNNKALWIFIKKYFVNIKANIIFYNTYRRKK